MKDVEGTGERGDATCARACVIDIPRLWCGPMHRGGGGGAHAPGVPGARLKGMTRSLTVFTESNGSLPPTCGEAQQQSRHRCVCQPPEDSPDAGYRAVRGLKRP